MGLYQWAVHQGDKSQQRFMQKLESGDLMNAEGSQPEPHIEAVKQRLAAGADVNEKDNDGWTSLHNAALGGDKEIAELLIAKGADVNAKYDDGSTPLHWAADMGHKEIAEILITKGADVNAKDEDGRTALDWAHGETAQLLRKLAALLRKHGGKTGEELKAEGK